MPHQLSQIHSALMFHHNKFHMTLGFVFCFLILSYLSNQSPLNSGCKNNNVTQLGKKIHYPFLKSSMDLLKYFSISDKDDNAILRSIAEIAFFETNISFTNKVADLN
jgi:hypothetical protein